MTQDQKQKQREAITAECAKRGIAIERRGHVYTLTGVGVDLSTIDLAYLTPSSLDPYVSRDAREARAVV